MLTPCPSLVLDQTPHPAQCPHQQGAKESHQGSPWGLVERPCPPLCRELSPRPRKPRGLPSWAHLKASSRGTPASGMEVKNKSQAWASTEELRPWSREVSHTCKGQGGGRRPGVLRSQGRPKCDLALGGEGKSGLLPQTMLSPPNVGSVNPTSTRAGSLLEPFESSLPENNHIRPLIQKARRSCKVQSHGSACMLLGSHAL